MNNKLVNLTILMICSLYANAQNDCSPKTVDKSINRKLPKGICIAESYTIDQVIIIDFDKDNDKDVIIRYSIYPLKNGADRYYAFYQKVNDSTFNRIKELKNIIPPYLRNVYAATSSSDSLDNALVAQYPYDMSVDFVSDTIKISHSIPDYYGKTYEFVYENKSSNWFLQRISYWIGNMDQRDIERMDLSLKLVNKVILERKRVEKNVSIDNFNLVKSKSSANQEEKTHLINTYDLFQWSVR